MRRVVPTALLALALAACSAPPAATVPDPAPYTDAGGVQREALDPAAVEVQECEVTADDYGDGDLFRGARARFRAVNTTGLEGVVSLTVQYQDVDGTVVTEGVPGAGNIRPGQAVILEDAVGVEDGDLAAGEVRCVVVEAEVYVPVK